MQTTHYTPSVLSYAHSLLELADEQQQLEPIGQELSQLREVIEQNPVFAQFLADPGIGLDERNRVMEQTFGGKLSPLMHNFLGVLNQRGKLGTLPELAAAYHDLLDDKLGKIEVDVTVAHRLSDEQLEDVRQKVGAALKKDVVIHQYVDESIIGGLILRVQDKLIDASVKTQLNSIREKMLAARPA